MRLREGRQLGQPNRQIYLAPKFGFLPVGYAILIPQHSSVYDTLGMSSWQKDELDLYKRVEFVQAKRKESILQERGK